MTQRTVNRRELLQTEIRKREALYADFIAECGKFIVDSYTHTLDKPETVLSLADRVIVLKRGAVVREFANEQISKDRLLEAA